MLTAQRLFHTDPINTWTSSDLFYPGSFEIDDNCNRLEQFRPSVLGLPWTGNWSFPYTQSIQWAFSSTNQPFWCGWNWSWVNQATPLKFSARGFSWQTKKCYPLCIRWTIHGSILCLSVFASNPLNLLKIDATAMITKIPSTHFPITQLNSNFEFTPDVSFFINLLRVGINQ